jgi:hypothetical protein
MGDATLTARLKPGADKSGNKISPRRAVVFAPIRGESAGHRRLAVSPIRCFASLQPDPFASTASSPRAAPVMMATTSDIVCFCGLVRAARRPRRMI